jgi:hypothetical protein
MKAMRIRATKAKLQKCLDVELALACADLWKHGQTASKAKILAALAAVRTAREVIR